jgi:DNA polymerase I
MKQVLALSQRFDTYKFLFAWDSRKSRRRSIYPDYKNRPQLADDEYQFEKTAFQQFIELRITTLPLFGFRNNFIQTGMEADDIIAALTQNYKREFVIISGDGDLYQLLSGHVSMYSPKKKKLVTEKSFIAEYDITPEQWITVKQVAGCRSDKVEGISGIGDKRAIQYIKGTLNEKTKGYQNILAGKDIIDRNEALVKLPFKGTLVPTIKDDATFNLGNFIDLTDKYGFRSFQQPLQLQDWMNQFDME